MLQERLKGNSKDFQGCFKKVLMIFQNASIGNSRKIEESVKKLSRWFQKDYKAISEKIVSGEKSQRLFKEVST